MPLLKRILSKFWNHPLPASEGGQTLAQEVSIEDPPIGTEEQEELRDTLSLIYDQLKILKSWWILELIPLEFRQQLGNGEWVSWLGYVQGNHRSAI